MEPQSRTRALTRQAPSPPRPCTEPASGLVGRARAIAAAPGRDSCPASPTPTHRPASRCDRLSRGSSLKGRTVERAPKAEPGGVLRLARGAESWGWSNPQHQLRLPEGTAQDTSHRNIVMTAAREHHPARPKSPEQRAAWGPEICHTGGSVNKQSEDRAGLCEQCSWGDIATA